MRVLIVDDSLDKLAEVSKTIISKNKSTSIFIDTVEDIQTALQFLQKNEIDLLILDQYLPQRKEEKEKIITNGGKILLQEIERKGDKIITPRYIVGLTQHYEEKIDFSPVWALLKYSPSETQWSNNLSKIISHIINVNNKRPETNNNSEFKPTIFLEGLTDLFLFEKVIDFFHSDIKNMISLKSQNNAGANWVAQQMVIWGHMLPKTDNNESIKAVGLFDADEAGLKAKNDMTQKLTSQNQQKNCKSFQLQPKHVKNLVEFYKIGIKVEIEIESLLPIEILKIADENGWLEYRNPMFIESPKDWNPVEETIPNFLTRKEISEDYTVFLKKTKLKYKKRFNQFVLAQSEKNPEILNNISLVFEELKKAIL